MQDTIKELDPGKEAMKTLKAARQEQIAAATARMKIHRQAVKAIKEQLQAGELTVPELAEATGLGADQVLWYVASLKKFGEILEGSKDGGYYRYRLGKIPVETPAAE